MVHESSLWPKRVSHKQTVRKWSKQTNKVNSHLLNRQNTKKRSKQNSFFTFFFCFVVSCVSPKYTVAQTNRTMCCVLHFTWKKWAPRPRLTHPWLLLSDSVLCVGIQLQHIVYYAAQVSLCIDRHLCSHSITSTLCTLVCVCMCV